MTQRLKDAESSEFTIPANSYLEIPAAGEFVRCFEASDTFKMSVNDGGKVYFAGGIEYRPPGMQEFDKITLFNETGADIDVTLGFGGGQITDSRFTASSNLKVENAVGGTLKTDDDETQTKLDSILAMLQNATDQRLPVLDMSAASYAEAQNATVTALDASAGDNANGFILHHYDIGPGGNSGYLKAGSDYIAFLQGSSGAAPHDSKSSNMKFASGIDFEINNSNTARFTSAWFTEL